MDFKDDISVGGQLRVGTGICPAIKEGDQKINGSALVEGPMVIGDPMAFGTNKATLMLGPNNNDDPDCEMPECSVGVSGNLPSVLRCKVIKSLKEIYMLQDQLIVFLLDV